MVDLDTFLNQPGQTCPWQKTFFSTHVTRKSLDGEIATLLTNLQNFLDTMVQHVLGEKHKAFTGVVISETQR